MPNTTETNSQRSLTENPNPSTKWTQTRPLWQAQSDHAALLVCLDSQHQWEWTLPRGFASRWLDALHLWWRGPSEPRLVVVETRRPVEKQTANQDPAPSSPVCPDDHCARDRICVRAQMANRSLKSVHFSSNRRHLDIRTLQRVKHHHEQHLLSSAQCLLR